MFARHEAIPLRDIEQQEMTMRKTMLTIFGVLVITGSAVQMATASEHHVSKASRAWMSTSQQFRNANASYQDGASSLPSGNFDRRNTFN
jgi:hypothetical protein